MLTIERLKELVHYNPETGKFTWLIDRYGPNGRAGEEAGHSRTFKSSSKRYVYIGIDRKRYCAHRLAFFYMTGWWPKPKHHIDHKDGDGWNNKWENLREATHKENMLNSKVRANNIAGVKGVSKTRQGRFIVRLSLGTYNTLEEAIEVYNRAILQYHGDFAKFAEKPKVLNA